MVLVYVIVDAVAAALALAGGGVRNHMASAENGTSFVNDVSSSPFGRHARFQLDTCTELGATVPN